MIAPLVSLWLVALLAPPGVPSPMPSDMPSGMPSQVPTAMPSNQPPIGPVYPAGSTPLRFDHARHTALEIPCGRCHAAAETSVRPGDRLLPAEAVCFECHDPRAAAEPAAGCASCHPGYQPDSLPADARQTALARPYPPAVELPVAALNFGHRPHLARGAACADCHRGIAASTDAAERFLPDMGTCVECHQRVGASTACATCHPAGPDGLLRTDLPGGSLRPRGRFHPADHRGDFARRHAGIAQADPTYCARCHQTGGTLSRPGCDDCHADHRKPLSLHPADYVRTHGIEARRAAECSGCHREQTFCLDCHTRSGVGLSPGPTTFGRTEGGARFHGPGFVGDDGSPPGPTHHRHAARRNLRDCTSCHQESDCVTCHAAGAPSGFAAPSPHPPGFDCGPFERNARGCLKCHADRLALDRLCR